MTTEAPIDGTNPTDTAATATPPAGDTLLTAEPAAAAAPAEPVPTPDAKPEDKPAEAAKPEDAPQGAPEEYADFTLPEGAKVNAEALADLKAFAKEKNLSQEDAQKLVDLGVKNAQDVTTTMQAHIEQVRNEWSEASRTDKEFGGDKLDENLAVAKQALDTFGTPELTALLTESGLGSHPEVVRAFFRVGKAISEDRLVPGTKAPASRDPLSKLYPSMATH